MRIALSATCLLLLAVTSVQAQQQIPGGGFENWVTTSYGGELPQGAPGMNWVSASDSSVALYGGWSQKPSVKKTTSAHSGTYALCLQESYFEIPGNNYKDSGGAAICLGPVSLTTFAPTGVPYTDRPTALTGYYKITANTPGADTADIRIVFRKAHATIGDATMQFHTTTTGYQAFTMPINWYTGQSPDTLRLQMNNGAVDVTCNDTSTRFYLDDIAFTFPSGIQENLFANAHITAYPNPTADLVHIQLDDLYLAGDCFITVHDASGRVVLKTGQLQKQQALSLRGNGCGTYFIQLHKGSETVYGTKITLVQ